LPRPLVDPEVLDAKCAAPPRQSPPSGNAAISAAGLLVLLR
jgi:hypothetical protein